VTKAAQGFEDEFEAADEDDDVPQTWERGL